MVGYIKSNLLLSFPLFSANGVMKAGDEEPDQPTTTRTAAEAGGSARGSADVAKSKAASGAANILKRQRLKPKVSKGSKIMS